MLLHGLVVLGQQTTSALCLGQHTLALSPLQLVCIEHQQLACCAGLTPVDVAINNKQVTIVRRLEQGSAFSGWLSQKVTKYVPIRKQACCISMHKEHRLSMHPTMTMLSSCDPAEYVIVV